jgi:hypothetical protein
MAAGLRQPTKAASISSRCWWPQDKRSHYKFSSMKRPIGISVLAALYVLMMTYNAATIWRVLGIHGLGLPLANIVAGLELIVLGFLWWGYNWARWLFIAKQVWDICITCYDHFVRPPSPFIAEVGPLVVIVIAACIVAYLCMPHVRGWFRSRCNTKRQAP